MFSKYNGIKSEINSRRKFSKFTNMWKFKNTLLKIQCVKEKNTRKLENTPR